MDLHSLSENSVRHMDDRQFRTLLTQVLEEQRRDRQENQLCYYEPASERAGRVHQSNARVVGIGGGNGSSKTETALVEMVTIATGVIPDAFKDDPAWREKLRGPVHCRVICESLTNVLHTIILPKLKWWEWSGVSYPGGPKGHYGWIPRECLVGGSWDKSWSEKYRLLRVLYRNPENPTQVEGESTIQFMSADQDPSDFASGDFHFVLFDEPPRYAIWRENQARTMRVAGRMMLAMTWPDDPSIPVDWLFDEVYDKAQEGPNKDPNIDWFDLWTTDNRHLDQDAVAQQSASWSDEVRKVRIYGQPIRFSNRIHPLFTDTSDIWCFSCGKTTVPHEGKCSCGSMDLLKFSHVEPFDPNPVWPTVWVLDPHPRKPHMFAWVQIDPSDDWWVLREGQMDGDPTEVRQYCDRVEGGLGISMAARLIDPNMGRSPSSASRGVTWQDEFDRAGLVTDLADDSEVGRARVNEMLRPDPRTRSPRIHVHPSCETLIHQMKRYVWDDYKQSLEKDQKQRPKTKNDDFPTILKYLANMEPTFSFLHGGPRIVRRMGRNRDSRSHVTRTVRTPGYGGMNLAP